jgi:hypothetical protein
MPEISAEDVGSFLQIEAEKGFPVDTAQLQIARSYQKTTGGEFVTQLAVRQEQIAQLGAALRAAGLKPVSYSLGLAMLPQAIPPAGSGGRITVAIDPAGVTLLIAAGGGIAAFRTFEASIESEAGEKIVNGAAVARELRITFEQVPAALRSEVKQLFLTGESTMVRQLAESLGLWAKAAGLTIERGDLPEKNVETEMAELLAVNWLAGTGTRDPGHWIPTIASRPEPPGHPQQPVSPRATKGRSPDGIPPGGHAPGYRVGAGENRGGGNLPPDFEVILENRSSAPPTAAAPARCESSRLGPAPDRELARSTDESDGPHRQCSDCVLRARGAILRRRVRWNL